MRELDGRSDIFASFSIFVNTSYYGACAIPFRGYIARTIFFNKAIFVMPYRRYKMRFDVRSLDINGRKLMAEINEAQRISAITDFNSFYVQKYICQARNGKKEIINFI